MSEGIHDLVISATEINEHHGVGILLLRYFPDSKGIITLRSSSHYGGEEPFGIEHLELASRCMSLRETEQKLRELLAGRRIRRILSVPYYREDFIHAALAKKITGAPLAVFVMDDQNVFTHEVPDNRVAELLDAADLRLGISPELCEAYRLKYGHELHTMPPVLTPGPKAVPNHWIPGQDRPFTCAMIGNVWKKSQFERLRSTIREAGIEVHWFGNGPKAGWLDADLDKLDEEGIKVMGFLEEMTLASILSSYPLVLVPSGTLDGEDDNPSFSRLSLPSRVCFIAARTNTPILVLGHGESAAGRFVRRLKIGNCCGYGGKALLDGIKLITEPQRHRKMCERLRETAEHLVHPDPGAWLWDSLAAGKALRSPWQKAFAPRRTWYGRSLEVPPPLEVNPWKPAKALTKPESWETTQESELPGFGFTRSHHLKLVFGKDAEAQSLGCELGLLNAELTGGLALRFGKKDGDWLVVGTPAGGFLEKVPETVRLWQIADCGAWLNTHCPGDAAWIKLLKGKTTETQPPAAFDLILSAQTGNHLSDADTEKFRHWNTFLEKHAKTGCFQAHALNGLLHPDYFWRHALYQSMVEAFNPPSTCHLDAILSADDLWVMGEEAYNKFWKPAINRNYREFGRPLGLILTWRNL